MKNTSSIKVVFKELGDINYNDFIEVILVAEFPKFSSKDLGIKDNQSILYGNQFITFIKLTNDAYEVGSKIAKKLQSSDASQFLLISSFPSKKHLISAVEAMRLYYPQFDMFKSVKQLNKEVVCEVKDANEYHFKQMDIVVEATQFAKTLVNLPPNLLRPSNMVKHVNEFTQLGINITTLHGSDIEKMGCLEAVGRGSVDQSKLIIAEWKKNDGPYIALVGKGITFDTGGYSIKPANGMMSMKSDMSGAAVVAAVIKAVAELDLNINLLSVMPCAENMINGEAYRPDDILISYSGKTVEIVNTDAEGRLVLADAMSYVQEKYSIAKMIDLATLTGAMIVSLGSRYAGIFSNNSTLCNELINAGENVGEYIYRMPLHKDYDKLINSSIADMKNASGPGTPGAITAAQFLQRFVDDKVEWAHIDIAGVAFTKESSSFHKEHASGFGVRLLLDYLINQSS